MGFPHNTKYGARIQNSGVRIQNSCIRFADGYNLLVFCLHCAEFKRTNVASAPQPIGLAGMNPAGGLKQDQAIRLIAYAYGYCHQACTVRLTLVGLRSLAE